uniref:Uncharacterized protein n=1 Tax=Rhizophora mucronata TaxID=61149 RepID=A0A2P2NEY0_RHIMU
MAKKCEVAFPSVILEQRILITTCSLIK